MALSHLRHTGHSGTYKIIPRPLYEGVSLRYAPTPNSFEHTIDIGVKVAVVLRLARLGRHKSPVYRIVAAEKESRRDGRFLDIVGTYNPRTSPSTVTLKDDRVSKWLDVGAKPSETVRALLKRSLPGAIEAKEEHRTKKIQAARKKRKERAAKKAA